MEIISIENCRKELIELDKTRKAIKCFDKAIELFPEVIQCYKLSCGLGNINVQTDVNRIKSSIVFFDKIIKLVPNFGIAYNSIGFAYFFSVYYEGDYHYLGKNYEDIRIFYNKIINYFDIAIKLNPKDIIAQFNKADTLMFKASDLNYQFKYDKYMEDEDNFQEYLMEHEDKKWSPWDLDSDTMSCKRTDENGNEEYGDYVDWEGEQHYESEEEIIEKEELEEKESREIFIRDEKIKNEIAFLKEQSFFLYNFIINTYKQNIWYAYYRRAQKYFNTKSYRNCINDYNISIKLNPNNPNIHEITENKIIAENKLTPCLKSKNS